MRELIQHIHKKIYTFSNFISQIHNVNNLMPAISYDSSNKYIHAQCIFLALWYTYYFLYIKLMILNYAWSFNPLPFHSPVNFVPYNCIKTMLQFVPSYTYIYIPLLMPAWLSMVFLFDLEKSVYIKIDC